MPRKLRLRLALRLGLVALPLLDPFAASSASASFSVILPHEANNGARAASAPSAAMRVHASATVPPQVESITPTGTCSRCSISRAKYHATAEKFLAVSGVEAAQPASRLDIVQRKFDGFLFHDQQPDVRVARMRQIRVRRRRLAHCELHVRLTGSNPHVADQNVVELDNLGSRRRGITAGGCGRSRRPLIEMARQPRLAEDKRSISPMVPLWLSGSRRES